MANGGMAAILVGLAIAIYVSITVWNNIGLNTGLYATVINVFFPLIIFGAAVSILLSYIGGQ